MREGWREVRLGEVLALDVDPVRVRPETEYQLAGVYSFGRGLFRRDPLLGAKTSYKQLHRLRKDQFVLSKLKAWEGAVAVVGEALAGFVLSPEFPTFSIKGELEPSYLSLLCGDARFWERLRLESRGVGGRRERVHPRRLLEVSVSLPSLAEQRRIVDLADSVDHLTSAARHQTQLSEVALAELREGLLSSGAAPLMSLRSLLLRIDGGRSPVTSGRLAEYGERGVLKLSAVRPGYFVPGETKALDDSTAMPDAALIGVGDVLITRSNTSATVGTPCHVDLVWPSTYLSDLTLRLVPRRSVVDPRYLVEALLSRDARKQIQGGARGTSGSMKKISRELIYQYTVPVPGLTEQERIVDVLNDVRDVARRSDELAISAERLRIRMVDDLLSGHHQIPDVYDALLEFTP